MRCVRFNESISREILQAVIMSEEKCRLRVKKGDGSTAFDLFRLDTRENVQKLADALNKKFPMRQYSVETVETEKVNNLELVK